MEETRLRLELAERVVDEVATLSKAVAMVVAAAVAVLVALTSAVQARKDSVAVKVTHMVAAVAEEKVPLEKTKPPLLTTLTGAMACRGTVLPSQVVVAAVASTQ
jgi:hypothetical protein